MLSLDFSLIPNGFIVHLPKCISAFIGFQHLEQLVLQNINCLQEITAIECTTGYQKTTGLFFLCQGLELWACIATVEWLMKGRLSRTKKLLQTIDIQSLKTHLASFSWFDVSKH